MVEHQVTHDPEDPDFPHGTTRGNSRGCKCRPCFLAARRTEKRRKMHRDKTGRPYSVPASRVAQHITAVMEEAGVRPWAIGEASGVAPSAVVRILGGTTKTVRFDVASRLLSTTTEKALAVPGALVSAKKSVQLIRSMQAQGFTLNWQASAMGLAESRIAEIARKGHHDFKVTVKTEKALRALADRVGFRTGESRRAMLLVRKKGWHPLAAYDDRGDLIPEAVTEDPEEVRAGAVMTALHRMATLRQTMLLVSCETGISTDHLRIYRNATDMQMIRVLGGTWEIDPKTTNKFREVYDQYEWNGWTATKCLAELGIVLVPEKRRSKTEKVS